MRCDAIECDEMKRVDGRCRSRDWRQGRGGGGGAHRRDESAGVYTGQASLHFGYIKWIGGGVAWGDVGWGEVK